MKLININSKGLSSSQKSDISKQSALIANASNKETDLLIFYSGWTNAHIFDSFTSSKINVLRPNIPRLRNGLAAKNLISLEDRKITIDWRHLKALASVPVAMTKTANKKHPGRRGKIYIAQVNSKQRKDSLIERFLLGRIYTKSDAAALNRLFAKEKRLARIQKTIEDFNSFEKERNIELLFSKEEELEQISMTVTNDLPF